MEKLLRCDRCGSARSIEFDMCQVCYKDYSRLDTSVETESKRLLEEAKSTIDSPFRFDCLPRRNIEIFERGIKTG